MRLRGRRLESGSAVVEFLAALVLLTSIFLAVVQAATFVYVQNVALAAAYEGSRHGAVIGGGIEMAQERAASVIKGALGSYANGLHVEVRRYGETIETTVKGRIVPFIPLIPPLPISARARILSEEEFLI